mmetsp:Transcript_45038/g.104330  ORF Transcript_45038/g.104330 Transcript_45038/m.104330 type:complete len:390 (+) Transcript_45038:77-1246(+)
MVELRFESLEADGMPSECYVSVRIGEHQKFSRLSEKRSFKFAQAPKEGRYSSRYGKIEIFRRIGSCGLDVDPAREGLREVLVNCSEAGFGSVSMQVALDKLGKTVPGGEDAVPAVDEHPPVQSTRGQQAKDYLREHCLEVCLSDAVQAVLRERPADPILMLVQKLQAASKSRIVRQDERPESQQSGVAPSTIPQQTEAEDAATGEQKLVESQPERGPTPLQGLTSATGSKEQRPVETISADQLSRETKELARSLVDSARSGKLLPLLKDLSQHRSACLATQEPDAWCLPAEDRSSGSNAARSRAWDSSDRCGPDSTRQNLISGRVTSLPPSVASPPLDAQKQLSSPCTARLEVGQPSAIDLVTALPSIGSWYNRRLQPLARSVSRGGSS